MHIQSELCNVKLFLAVESTIVCWVRVGLNFNPKHKTKPRFSYYKSAEVVKEAYFHAILSKYVIEIDVQEKAYIAYAVLINV